MTCLERVFSFCKTHTCGQLSITASIAILLSFVPQSVMAQETATGGVNGAAGQLVEGQVVATGKPIDVEGETWCEFPKTTIGTKNGPDVVESSVVATITEDCNLVIASVNRAYGGSFGPTSTRYRGTALATLEEVASGTVMQSHADMHYYDDGSGVYGEQYLTWCYNAPWWNTGWSNWGWSPSGPSSVSIWKLCNASFHYEVTLDATFYGWPGGAWQSTCDIYGGIPKGDFKCGGDHYPA